MIQRILGVFKLSIPNFEEIEKDKNATMQAALVVLVVALVSGIGSGLFSSIMQGSFIKSFFSTVISAFLGWIVWAVVSWFVGTKFFGGQADIGEMLRVIGFSYTPQVLSIIPCVGGIIGWIWSIIAGFIAIRQGLDLDNTKTFFTVAIGFLFYLILFFVMGAIFGVSSALLGGLGGS